MNKYEEIQVYIVCHFLSLAVNALICGICRWNLFVLTQVEFDILFEWKASDMPWKTLICALREERGEKRTGFEERRKKEVLAMIISVV